MWKTDKQGYILSSFFYGYVVTQIPFGLLSKKYGSIYFLGVGMLINSVFGLVVPIAADLGFWWLIAVRFIQGLGEVSRIIEQVQSEKPLEPANAYTGEKCCWYVFSLLYILLVFNCKISGQGPIVPCTHALLAKWIPPNERSRMGAFVYAGIKPLNKLKTKLWCLAVDVSGFCIFFTRVFLYSSHFWWFTESSDSADKLQHAKLK